MTVNVGIYRRGGMISSLVRQTVSAWGFRCSWVRCTNMPSFFFARWYLWLVSRRRVDMHDQSSRREGSNTHDTSMATPPTYIAYHVQDTTPGEHGEKRGF